ncbi:sensor domain-containing diguanylate cyclase [Sphingomonas sp. LHG3406-1]|uniref:sensor domain-containing diguanylate cyclase n=1 Tax=Sphingomonas sp. LHG3406-1 TaxID=2804617 RepID=UPI00260F0D8F|nr:sensor domain-containing diguanylate cyclase [Sphingomonas sp. LHG3406-1]
MSDPKLTDEAGRLLALHRYCALDSMHEPNFDTITGLVRDLLGVPICAISLIDSDEQRFKSIQGLDVESTSREVAFCDHTIRGREPLVVPDAHDDERFANNPLVTGDLSIRAYAGAPLQTPDGFNLGALCAIHRRRHDFTPGDIALLERFAKVVVDQMELRSLAHRDSLTGALTRRAFFEGAEAALKQLLAEKRSATVAVLDVDHFKVVNDTQGHPIGDKVLKGISQLIGAQLRSADLFGRLGGEEFAILFYATTKAEALHCAERIRRAIEDRVDPDCPKVTVSIGLAAVNQGERIDAALAQADAALYVAKREGRNRCVSAAPALSAAA